MTDESPITADEVARLYHGDGDFMWTDRHVGALVRELEERDEQFDKGYEAGKLDALSDVCQPQPHDYQRGPVAAVNHQLGAILSCRNCLHVKDGVEIIADMGADSVE